MRYRVMRGRHPIVHGDHYWIERRGFFFGWSLAGGDDTGGELVFATAEEAEEVLRKWCAPKKRPDVVSEWE